VLATLPSYDTFVALLGERFMVAGPAGDVALELERVTAQPVRRAGQAVPFTLVFRGPRQALLPQATVRFRHPRLETEIFIVPVGADAAGYWYEAVFNP
jgi:hypothetical protein